MMMTMTMMMIMLMMMMMLLMMITTCCLYNDADGTEWLQREGAAHQCARHKPQLGPKVPGWEVEGIR
eukprot:6413276-Karenia_brevis.AAC.1